MLKQPKPGPASSTEKQRAYLERAAKSGAKRVPIDFPGEVLDLIDDLKEWGYGTTTKEVVINAIRDAHDAESAG